MLILTRKSNESIQIGDDVTVTVLSIQGNQVSIGIDAPKDVGVHRDEVYEKIINLNQAIPIKNWKNGVINLRDMRMTVRHDSAESKKLNATCSTKDEGGPLVAGLQDLATNYLKLQRLKVNVVSV